MTERKLKVLFHLFSYSGNGAIPSCSPAVYQWLLAVQAKLYVDPRIESVHFIDVADTPITMVRNQAVIAARKMKADVLVMIDSDMHPDKRLQDGDPVARPFFQSSFDFLYKHYDRGPVAIGAPYCGPPPNECVYVFHWASDQSENPNMQARLTKYTREHAAQMIGIQHCAALPTGLIMYDMRAFDLTEPCRKQEKLLELLMAPIEQQFNDGLPFTREQMREIVQRALDAKHNAEQSWFYYEWTDQYQQNKASTEDVTQTRDIAYHGLLQLGYNPLYCNWDAWAGHYKVKCVDKPVVLFSDDVQEKYKNAVMENRCRVNRYMELDLMETP